MVAPATLGFAVVVEVLASKVLPRYHLGHKEGKGGQGPGAEGKLAS